MMKKSGLLLLFISLIQLNIKAQTITSATPLSCFRGDTLILNITASASISNPYSLNLVLGSNTEKPFSAYNTSGFNYELTYYVKEYAPVGNYTLTNGAGITYGTPIVISAHNFGQQFNYQSVSSLALGITAASNWYDENGIRKIIVDNAGNKYIAGVYTGSSTLGSFSFSNTGNKDGFIAKINAAGVVRWVKTINGANDEGFYSLKLYNDSVLYVCGFATGGSTLKYNNVNLTQYSLRNSGTRDGILMKLDTAGTLINYAFQGSKKIDYTTDMDIDAAGNVYVTGSLQGDKYGSSPNDTCATYVYSSQVADSVRLKAYSNDSYGLIIAKYSPQLHVLWAKRQDRDYFSYGAEGRGIRLTNSNGIVVLGWTQGPVTWGGTASNNASCCNYHYCLLKTDINGNKLWAEEAGNFSETTSFGLDSLDNIYLPATYGGATDNTKLYKYSPAGMLLWSVLVNNNPAPSNKFYIETDAAGNSYMTYSYQHLWATSGWNVIFKKFDKNGLIKAVSFPTPYSINNNNGPTAIAINPAGNKVFVAGNYSGNQTFGTTLISGATIRTFFIGMNITPSSFTGIPYQGYQEQMLNLYPNPASLQVTLSFALDKNKKVKVKIYNVKGEECDIINDFSGLEGLNSIQLDIRHLPEGIYFAQIMLDGNVAATKLFIVSK